MPTGGGTGPHPFGSESNGTVKFRSVSHGRMVFIFKRRRKPKQEDEAATPPTPTDTAQEPDSPATPEPSREAEPVPSAASAPVPELTPAVPPPPLPTATAPPASAAPVAAPADCFLCGTPLVDHHCPKCQMTWVE